MDTKHIMMMMMMMIITLVINNTQILPLASPQNNKQQTINKRIWEVIGNRQPVKLLSSTLNQHDITY